MFHGKINNINKVFIQVDFPLSVVMVTEKLAEDKVIPLMMYCIIFFNNVHDHHVADWCLPRCTISRQKSNW